MFQVDASNTEKGIYNIRDDNKEELINKINSLNYQPMIHELRENIRIKQICNSYEFRMAQIKQIRRALDERMEDILEAAKLDLGRHRSEGFQGEVGSTVASIDACLGNLKQWMSPESVSHPLMVQMGNSQIVKQAKGVILVIAPWNYPVHLAITPLVEAIAGGNAVVLKPSELTPASAKILEEIVDQYVDPRICRVVQGAVAETQALLKERFDHIFYTGNGAVGRIVATAAAKHLTPVTLELGGKSPVYVSESANIEVTSSRLVGTKLFNSGQTCVAPDYILCHESKVGELCQKLSEKLTQFFGSDLRNSESLGRIVNERHWDRLARLISENHGGEIITGGLDTADRNDKFIPLTIILNPNPNSAVMTEEIFGPILPIYTVSSNQEAVDFINNKESPLALYIFSEDETEYNNIVAKTTSGGVCINDCILHIANLNLPFGGFGGSGYGSYHGKFGFDEFTHQRSVMFRSTYFDPRARYAPYKDGDVDLLKRVIMGPLIPEHVKNAMIGAGLFAAGLLIAKSRL